jgi:hypothetical protein
MRLGEVLLARGLVQQADINRALTLQREKGGRLGEHLVAIRALTPEQLRGVIEDTPTMPRNVAETGITRGLLMGLVLKFMRVASCETLPDFATRMHLSTPVIQELLDEATQQKLVYVLGSTTVGLMRYMRYALSDQGRVAAGEALEQSLYLGPAPVSLEAFKAQVMRQKLSNEALNIGRLKKAFAGMIMSEHTIRRLTPAVSSGRTVLLYGPPGNGKTSVGTRVADVFTDPVFIPHAIEIAGQIIKMYDPGLHRAYQLPGSAPAAPKSPLLAAAPQGVHVESFDARWVSCRRPVAMAGGEMTLDMLDLRWDPITKTYDAPLHMKALNGVFLIDDFGRQKVNPTELLNRWIVPLESRIDYLKLTTGNTFQLPFDELVIFSTNLEPADLMDPAFLRRIPYKIRMRGPSRADYREIFHRTAKSFSLEAPDDVIDFVIETLTRNAAYELASFQPRFLCDQAAEECRCFDLPRVITREIAATALNNLYVGILEEDDQIFQ